MTPCCLVKIYTRLGGNYCFHHQDKNQPNVEEYCTVLRSGTAAIRDLSEPIETRRKSEIIYDFQNVLREFFRIIGKFLPG
jgi:hypothetical protein